MTMRTPGLEEKYQSAITWRKLKDLRKEKPIQDFKYWLIVENRFPHDKIAEVNHMIVLKRECSSLLRLWPREWRELFVIIWRNRDKYDTFTYNLPSMTSIKNIPHAHLYKLKKEFK